MKYLKKYESFEEPENEYWKVKTETPYLELSLKKIGMTKKEQKVFLEDTVDNVIKNQEYIYIELDYTPRTLTAGIGSEYTWSYTPDVFNSDYYYDGKLTHKHAIYQGEIEITPEELKYWNFKNDVKKYNL